MSSPRVTRRLRNPSARRCLSAARSEPILGLLTRYLGILYAIEMIVATYVQWSVFSKGFSGAQLELLLLFIGILVATHGAGKYSLDRMLKME